MRRSPPKRQQARLPGREQRSTSGKRCGFEGKRVGSSGARYIGNGSALRLERSGVRSSVSLWNSVAAGKTTIESEGKSRMERKRKGRVWGVGSMSLRGPTVRETRLALAPVCCSVACPQLNSTRSRSFFYAIRNCGREGRIILHNNSHASQPTTSEAAPKR